MVNFNFNPDVCVLCGRYPSTGSLTASGRWRPPWSGWAIPLASSSDREAFHPPPTIPPLQKCPWCFKCSKSVLKYCPLRYTTIWTPQNQAKPVLQMVSMFCHDLWLRWKLCTCTSLSRIHRKIGNSVQKLSGDADAVRIFKKNIPFKV